VDDVKLIHRMRKGALYRPLPPKDRGEG